MARPNEKVDRNAEIVRRYLLPTSMTVLAHDFGVSRSLILSIIKRVGVHRPRIETYRTCLAVRTKICTLCEIEKDFDAFNRSGKSGDGMKPYCRVCASTQSSSYRAANLEMLHAREAIGRVRNAAQLKVRTKAKNARRQAAIKAGQIVPPPRDKLVRAVNEQRRRARKVAAGGDFRPHHVKALLKKQRSKCANVACRTRLAGGYHIDHVMPLKLGGSNSHRNIQLLCEPCNRRKAAKHPVEFAQENGLLL